MVDWRVGWYGLGVAKIGAAVAFGLFVHLWWRSGGIAAGPVWIAMAPLPAAVWDLGLMTFFFVAHSGFASERFKRWLGWGREATRRLYLLLTLPVTALMWGLWVPLARPVVWDARGRLDVPFLVLRLLAIAGLAWTVRSFSLHDFFGDRSRAAAGGPARLSVAGAFRICRHPLYFFMMLLAAAETWMPLGRALVAAALLVYVPIGSRLEERKLERDFGPDYTRYRARTPWLVPTPASIARAVRRRRPTVSDV